MKNYLTEIKWGFVFALVSLAWMAIEKLTGLHDVHIDKHPTYSSLFAIPAITVYVLALLEKKRKDYQGQMNYKQGFIAGLIITVVVALLSPLTQLITSYVITPDFFANATRHSVASGQMSREAAEEYFSLSNYLVQGFIGALFMGLITSAVVAFFVKSKTAQ